MPLRGAGTPSGQTGAVPRLEPRQITAVLWAAGLRSREGLINLTAIALAESGGQVDLVSGARRGMWLLNDSRGYDRAKMVTDAAYAAQCAIAVSAKGTTLSAWPTWTNGRYKLFLNAAQQAEALAAQVSGSILAEDGTYVPASFYANPNGLYDTQTVALGTVEQPRPVPGPVAPPSAGVPAPLTAQFERDGPLRGFYITGTKITGDFASTVVGDPEFTSGISEIPNLSFSIADPQGDLLWQKGNLWVAGTRVQWADLDLRIDEINFVPGSATTGQLDISAIDALVFALQRLRGARVVKNVSPTAFIREEIRLAGFDPNLYFLGENLPTMAQIARDVPTEQQGGGETEAKSAWTTIQRLASETGRRAFISGRKLIFGTVAFTRAWASPGGLRIGWHSSPEGERWLTMPSGSSQSGGTGSGGAKVSGKVPLNRARYFRPGVGVTVHNTPSIAAGDRLMVCSQIKHTIAVDTDGADVELMDPVDPKVEKKA